MDDNSGNTKKKDKTSLILFCFCVVLTIVFPILAIPINVLGIILSKGRIRKGYGLLLALSLAIMAYIWIPDESMDLYRHHQQVSTLSGFNVERLGKYIGENLEPMQYLAKFWVAQTHNSNLLQFIVVLLGYFGITWVVCDLADLKAMKKSVVFLLLIYALTALNFIGFASGLWFYLATVCTLLGIYLHYFRNSKYLKYLFYFMAPCLHIGTLYIVIIVILFSKLRLFRKIRMPVAISVFALALMFGAILSLLSSLIGAESTFAKILNGLYESYFVNGSQFDSLHSGWNLYLPVANTLLGLIMAIWCYKKKREDSFSPFVAYLAIYILATMFNAGVFVRYGFLMVMLSLPLLADYLCESRNKRGRLLLVSSVVILIILRGYFSINQMNSAGLLKQVNSNVTHNAFYIMEN